MKKRHAKLTVIYRPRIKRVVVLHRGRVVCRCHDYDSANAFVAGWREREKEIQAMTFSQLDKAAADMPFSDPLCAGVNHLIAHADDNAADEAGKMDSLRGLLAHTTAADAAPVVAWFTARGVRF